MNRINIPSKNKFFSSLKILLFLAHSMSSDTNKNAVVSSPYSSLKKYQNHLMSDAFDASFHFTIESEK